METIPYSNVYVAQTDAPHYERSIDSVLPEFTIDTPITTALMLLHRLFRDAGLDSPRYGTAEWNPLGDIIGNGLKVLLKPNWVQERNNLNNGSSECLVTHTSVIAAVLEYVIKTDPSQIIVGDAPIQNCDFEALSRRCKLNDMKTSFEQKGYKISIRDFRMTKMLNGKYGEKAEFCRDLNDYCLFDLGNDSWLAPITTENTEFRVTQYDPDKLKHNHCPGIHRYLIAREVMDADVVINLPKLKTHKKAGITGSLKNMVGINGFKEYLPHHRKGSVNQGGDCYHKGGRLRQLAENILDIANKSKTSYVRRCCFYFVAALNRLDTLFSKSTPNIDGSWYGNDTVWRMCLDLQRILHYGRADGQMTDRAQRKVITITDAIIAGDGEGPLAPSPVPLGIMTFGLSAVALEWIHCILMHFDPEQIPLITNAFMQNKWPLADFSPDDIQTYVNGERLPTTDTVARYGRYFAPPSGWQGHCEKVGYVSSSEQPCRPKHNYNFTNEQDA